MIDGDFSESDGISIGVEGSFILIGVIIGGDYCSPLLGFC
jgi:hypothetical protein